MECTILPFWDIVMARDPGLFLLNKRIPIHNRLLLMKL